MVMRLRLVLCAMLLCAMGAGPALMRGAENGDSKPQFHTSDRCVGCHNGMKTQSGVDFSIGFDWRSSIMANSSRDPYWQASVRRESLDHPESKAKVENDCSNCHMPIVHLSAKAEGKQAEVFSHLPFNSDNKKNDEAADGVSCSVCHQISKSNLGTRASFNGEVQIDSAPSKDARPEYGPFEVDAGHKRVMQSSTGGFVPTEAAHIRDSALCGSCHTLYTQAIGKDGKDVGVLPEQMPFLEWQHSDYPARSTCQSCHMPELQEPSTITAVFGQPRKGSRRHVFVAANFLMQRMLNNFRGDLAVEALPAELSAAADGTVEFLQSETARVSIRNIGPVTSGLQFELFVENLSGHKLPTAYPSRRAWLHVVVSNEKGEKIFESGALNKDGSIVGNDNDVDPTRFERHYREITSPEQVEIYEPILEDSKHHVTTGLLSAVGYLKDNRLLPSGFNKDTADRDIAVVGEAAKDGDFNDKGSLVRYSISTNGATGPFHIEAELMYQPIGFRWAHNLKPYDAAEPKRFVGYYDAMAAANAVVLCKAEATQ
jgi:hypothetical protein